MVNVSLKVMKKVVTIGAAVIDVTLKSSSLRVVKGHNLPGGEAICEMLGGKLEAQDGVLSVGGGGTNVAVGLKRLGESVKVITRLGDDDLAELVINKLDREGVGLEMIQRGGGKTGLSVVLVAEDGGRSIVTYRGESSEIEGERIDWKLLEKCDWIQVSSLGGQIELLEDLVGYAKEHKIGIGVNPGKRELEHKERLKKLIPRFDFFNVNRMEASDLWGVSFDDEKEIMRKFFETNSSLVAVTDGKRGANILSENRWVKMTAFPNKSVDDTGAGDAFVSGAVAGILKEKSLEEILKMGLANGGAEVTRLGAKEGLLNEKEMEKKLIRQLKTIEERF